MNIRKTKTKYAMVKTISIFLNQWEIYYVYMNFFFIILSLLTSIVAISTNHLCQVCVSNFFMGTDDWLNIRKWTIKLWKLKKYHQVSKMEEKIKLLDKFFLNTASSYLSYLHADIRIWLCSYRFHISEKNHCKVSSLFQQSRTQHTHTLTKTRSSLNHMDHTDDQ